MQMDGHSIDSNSGSIAERQLDNSPVQQGQGTVSQRVTIGSLHDDVLLVIFYHVSIIEGEHELLWNWEKLVHVCQRWRYLVFGSPNRLNLHLLCTVQSAVRRLLDVWPPLPLVIRSYNEISMPEWDESAAHLSDNLVAALEHRDRVCRIEITNPLDFILERIVTPLEEPFPALKHLELGLIAENYEASYPLPDTLLSGSAPSLQHLSLSAFSFPSLPRLLSSTSDLTSLHLWNIPVSGYISPVTMATSLSALPKLKSLSITFISPTYYPKRRNRPVPPLTRSVLPALTSFNFQGGSEYLEVIAARIDAPLLDESIITFFHQFQRDFDIPQISHFFGHLDSFRPSSVTLDFDPEDYLSVSVFFSSDTMPYSQSPHSWHIRNESLNLDRRISFVTQICSQILSFRPGVVSLIIKFRFWGYSASGLDIDPTIWLQLFHSFPSVQSLHIPASLEPFIAPALQGLTNESAAEVFPSLQTLSITGSPSDSNEVSRQVIDSFVTARGHSNHPIVVHRSAEEDESRST